MGGAPRKRLNTLGVRQRQPWRTKKDSARVTSAPERVQGENVPRPCLPERYIHVGTRTASRHPSHPCRGFPTVKQHKTESNTGYKKKKKRGASPVGTTRVATPCKQPGCQSSRHHPDPPFNAAHSGSRHARQPLTHRTAPSHPPPNTTRCRKTHRTQHDVDAAGHEEGPEPGGQGRHPVGHCSVGSKKRRP